MKSDEVGYDSSMDGIRTLGLFIASALAEIIGCYLPGMAIIMFGPRQT